MSLTLTIRQRLENLLSGAYAPYATYSFSTGRFYKHDRDLGPIEKHYDSSVERKFEVDLGPAFPLIQINPLDGFGLYEMEVKIKIGYMLTHSGDDQPEGSTEQAGTGYLDDIKSRANTDMHDIIRVLTWYQNYGGLSPDVFGITEKAFQLVEYDTKIVGVTTLLVKFQASTTTSWI
jgi:hypothetical protein